MLAAHLPIQLAARYGKNMCFVKYHVSEDQSSIVESSGGVQTLHSILMLNLSIDKNIQGQTYRKLQVMDIFWR